jgi:DNA-binding MarR family transcriptional regulator
VLGERDRIDGLLAQWGRERPDLNTTPLEVIARVARVSAHFDRLVDGWLARFGIKWWELDVLGALRRAGEPFRLSPSELSDRLMVSSGTMTTRVDRLAEKGLVAREPSVHDRRSVIVSLTEAGRTLVDEVMVIHLANLERILNPLGVDEQHEIAQSLRQLLIALEGAGSSTA